MKQYMAINKGKNTEFQKSDGVGKTLLEIYDKYQQAYVKCIKHFLPRIGNNPD